MLAVSLFAVSRIGFVLLRKLSRLVEHQISGKLSTQAMLDPFFTNLSSSAQSTLRYALAEVSFAWT